ncbi:MAG: hypothetical protein WBC33_01630 [Conexibacter sp.]
MTRLMRVLLVSALAAAIAASASATASAVTINPAGPFVLTSNVLQTFNLPSLPATFTCLWTLQGRLLTTQIPLVEQLVQIGGIVGATIECNEPVVITALVSQLARLPGAWPIGLVPNTGVLNLPRPTGMLVTLLNVRVRVVTPTFSCLYTGSIGLLFKNGSNQVVLLGGSFRATPTIVDTCLPELVATKGPGTLTVEPEWVIGP